MTLPAVDVSLLRKIMTLVTNVCSEECQEKSGVIFLIRNVIYYYEIAFFFAIVSLLFWYGKQTVCVKWGRCISDYFSISNGVRQDGTLSPKLFFVYVLDDLSDKLVTSKDGCSIDSLCMNHVM